MALLPDGQPTLSTLLVRDDHAQAARVLADKIGYEVTPPASSSLLSGSTACDIGETGSREKRLSTGAPSSSICTDVSAPGAVLGQTARAGRRLKSPYPAPAGQAEAASTKTPTARGASCYVVSRIEIGR